MDAIELLRYQSKVTWDWLEMTVRDVTTEEANWQPPGIANSIAATYAHTIICADEDFNLVYAGGETLLARGWAEKCGLSELPPPEFGWEWHPWAERVRMDWPAFQAYATEVRRCVDEFVHRLTDEGLKKPVDMTQWGLGMWTGLEMYLLHCVNHPRLHGGEIACLKGLQGQNAWETPWTSKQEPPAL